MPGSNNSKRTHLYSIRSTINIITQGYGIIGKAMGNFFRNTNKVCHIIFFMCVKTRLAGLMRNSLSFIYRSFIFKTGIRKEAERDTCHWIKVPDCTDLLYKKKLFFLKYTHPNAQSFNTEKKNLNTVIHWHSVHLVKTWTPLRNMYKRKAMEKRR